MHQTEETRARIIAETSALTPVERFDDQWFKRDDFFEFAEVRGGKARTCRHLAVDADKGLVTAGSRHSPQISIVAHVAAKLGLPCRIHTPTGEVTSELQDAIRCGGQRVAHRAGYNNVLIARAREDARSSGWLEIPFGMECQEAVDAAARQTFNLPQDIRRLVVPVGSGMTLAGVLVGLDQQQRTLPVLGVIVGADPYKRLDRWAPEQWCSMVRLVRSKTSYHKYASNLEWKGITVDPIYEAKCLPYLKKGDCLWIVGIRNMANNQS